MIIKKEFFVHSVEKTSVENFLSSQIRSVFIVCPLTSARDLFKGFGKSSQESTTNGLNIDNYCSILTSEDYIH